MAPEVVPVKINERYYRTIQEGQASILAPYQQESKESKKAAAQSGTPRNNDEGNQAVFYNPIQQYNRDLSVLAILVYGESAVALKRSRRDKNASLTQKKSRKADRGKHHEPDASRDVSITNTLAEANGSRKRKADEADLVKGDDVVANSSVKKTRSDADETYGMEEIEVQELKTRTVEPQTALPLEPKPQNEHPSADAATHTAKEKATRQVPFTILDALSASGLRAIRYAKEIPFASAIIANDLLSDAVEAINLNIKHNNLKDKVYSHVGDARHFMYSTTSNEHLSRVPGNIHKFDVVDLDPYGTAAPFLDAALQSVVDGGLLCVTCTDAGVWASNGYPEKAFALYSGLPLKGAHSHEAGLRLILHAISTSAAKYGIAIEPLLSLSIDFYARLFIRVHKSQQDVKLLAGTTMLVYNCDQGCGAWETQLAARNQERKAKNNDTYFKHGFAQAPSIDKHCGHCGSKSHLGGPIWAGPLHNPIFIRKILDRLPGLDKTVYGTTDRIKGMLTVALEEEELDWNPSMPRNVDPSNSAASRQAECDTASGTEIVKDSAIVPRLPPELLSPSPFFFLPTYLAKVISLPTPAEDPLRGAFLGLGYTCTRSHCKPGSFKTNAPWSVIWEVMREWARQQEPERIPRLLGEGEFVDRGSVKRSSPGWNILKRLRGREGDNVAVAKLRETLRQKLGYGIGAADIETKADLTTLLQSVLYELEHPVGKLNGVADQASSIAGVTEDRANANGQQMLTASQPQKITGKALIHGGGDPSELEVVFDAKLGKAFRESTEKLVRYQINPRANWGPMVRAGGA
ncbi:RNA methyltransferase tRNA(m5U54)methyltransferase [Neophaeococcomyces mojaviensis]|uniref:RNA methyltransferase tRNA(M5U54)methyltransferase n=1 Tax=Neophaeococcomyces mojaviensis TaxID=3383035 RepID=A0ACC3A7J0_9EURO|nr:RNA methyltransferase tRNA(m5U54)methyltransferase [Knufia sp. JES_112]